MLRSKSKLIPAKTPLVFANGTKVYSRFAREYITHKKGYFILAPSGAGKTHYVNSQKEKHWIDGDQIWEAANAHPREEWWLFNELIDEIDQKSDIITEQAKKIGLWIMGASNNWLKPDAIVIPHWSTHVKFIKYRETHNYDGGAKSDRLKQVLNHRKIIKQWIKKGVPQFDSVEAAVNHINSLYKKESKSKK